MKTKHLGGVVLGLLGALGCTNGNPDRSAPVAPPPAPPSAATPGALDAAHQAYLDGDYLALGERVRDVLLDARSSELVKENAYALLDKAYEVQKGHLPSRSTLPAGMEGVKYGVVRGASQQRPYYRVYLYGRMKDASQVRNLAVRILPDEPLLDSITGPAQLSVKPEGSSGLQRFVLEREVPELPRDGVLSLHFEMQDGTTSDSWFITHSAGSSATPEIQSPGSSSAVAAGHPLVSWTPFHSPEYLPFERRTLSVYVGDSAEGTAWDFWTQDYGDLAAVKIGDHPPAARTSLVPGDYWLNVTCGETRSFGPITLARESRSSLGFHAVP
jgi:hypothetical protein